MGLGEGQSVFNLTSYLATGATLPGNSPFRRVIFISWTKPSVTDYFSKSRAALFLTTQTQNISK